MGYKNTQSGRGDEARIPNLDLSIYSSHHYFTNILPSLTTALLLTDIVYYYEFLNYIDKIYKKSSKRLSGKISEIINTIITIKNGTIDIQ